MFVQAVLNSRELAGGKSFQERCTLIKLND